MMMQQALAEIKARGLKLHHTACGAGYVSRKPDAERNLGYATEYAGRFGEGIVLHLPRTDTSRYHILQYWTRTK